MRRLSILLLLLVLGLQIAAAQTVKKGATDAPANQKKTATQKLAKLIEPWPAPDVLLSRKADAERRALFQSTEPLVFTLESDFGAVNKDRNPESTQQFPAVLKVAGAGGQPASIPIKIGARGHVRRMSQTCNFVPLRLEFPTEGLKGTPFEGRSETLKLVTHCQNSRESDQYVLREFLAYKISNIMLERSFRSRLATVTYVDSKNGKTLMTRNGMLLEDDGDVARRMGGRTVTVERLAFKDLEIEPLTQLMVFEFMLGNTDFSIFALHNVVLVQTPDSKLHPVPYDFDLSGFVRPAYAVGDRRLGLKSVDERLYRGPCRTKEELDTVFAKFKAKKDEIMTAINSQPGLEADSKREVVPYLNDFYSLLDRPGSVKRFFIDNCKTAM
jgi:hypothetical protein